MTAYNKLSLPFIAFLALPFAAFSQSDDMSDEINESLKNRTNTTITTAVPFLIVGPDAYAGGIGDQGVATAPDANSMHWNAAKLAFVEKDMSFAVSYSPWLNNLVPDINMAYLGFFKRINERTTVGASLRYFNLGSITFRDANGNLTGQYTPNEFAVDAGAALKLSEYWSGAVAFRFIYSNLTLGQYVGTQVTQPGLAGAGDVSFYYTNPDKELFNKPVVWRWGLNISNIGSKIKYSESQPDGDFLPTNLRTGASATIEIDDYNQIGLMLEFNKLLVPSNPLYKRDPSTNQIIVDEDDEPIILKGQDPNRSVINALVTSFADAPGGFYEEMLEINLAIGVSYWYNQLFGVRAGFFYEPGSKGNRQYFTVGASVRYNVFGLDFSYLVPTVQRNPLENTVRFTLSFNFDKFGKINKKTDTDKK